MNKQEICEKIDRVRKERGMSVMDLSADANIDAKRVYHLVNRREAGYRLDTIIHLLDALDLEIDIRERAH